VAGRPDASAAAATTTRPPFVRNVRKPMPRPAPYKAAATGHEKKERHQSGT
jgi:hypothetical protein